MVLRVHAAFASKWQITHICASLCNPIPLQLILCKSHVVITQGEAYSRKGALLLNSDISKRTQRHPTTDALCTSSTDLRRCSYQSYSRKIYLLRSISLFFDMCVQLIITFV